MTPLRIAASGLATALGVGEATHREALASGRGGLVPCDFAGLRHGYVGVVDGVDAHRLPPALARFDCRNNRLADMALRADGFADSVGRARERYGAARIAVVVGTSTSGVLACEEAYRARDPASGALPRSFDYAHTQDLASLGRFVQAALALAGPALVISTACASSARAFGDAAQLIGTGVVDAAVVGGADSLCRMTLAGFASLGLVAPGPCRPFAAEREGISVGEAAGFCLLERGGDGPALLGAGASSDGHHMSSPRPDGAGAAIAMRSALRQAGIEPDAVEAINVHGTGTAANDAAEDRAIATVFGAGMTVSATKRYTGHTMGSCGVVEALIATFCLADAMLPASLPVGMPDPDFRARVVATLERRPLRRVLSNAFGFGGVNASLLFGFP